MNLTALDSVSKLSSRVIRVLAQNPGVGPLQGTNTYIVGTGAKRILIDSGDHPKVNPSADVDKYHSLLSDQMKKENCKIDTLLLTHWHRDHTGGVQPLKNSALNIVSETLSVRKFNCKKNEESNLSFINSYSNELIDNELIQVEGATLRVLYTPGHATDHASFYLEEENTLFTGDTILGETSAIVESLTDYMKTLNLYKNLNKPVAKIFPGHGPVVENGSEKIQEYIDHRLKREQQIIDCLRKEPMQAESILSIVYVGLADKFKTYALKNIEIHLEKLINEGLVKCENDKFKLIDK